jgi:hypothetical protein
MITLLNILNVHQTLAMDTLRLIDRPCGLIEILSKSNGCFSSKSQLRDILRQLILLGEVKHQANSQYKISVASAQQSKPIAKPRVESPHIVLSDVSPKKTPFVKQPSDQVKAVTPPFAMPVPLLSALKNLDYKLNIAGVVVGNLPLKIEVLERLSVLLSADIAEVLLSVVQDLKKITGDSRLDDKKS